MAITFPRADIAGMLRAADCRFELVSRQEMSRTADGRLRARDLGPAIWRAEFATPRMRMAEAQNIEAAFQSLDGSAKSFLMHDFRRPEPVSGESLGSFSPYIYAIGTNTMRLDGLPPDFDLGPGDYVAFTYSSTKRALHRIVEDAGATSLGRTPTFEVRPAIRPGAVVGTSVSLVNASCEMVLEPGSLDVATTDLITATVSFRAVQVIE